jgi:3-hydroxybutyrate dehydrogenase
MTVPPTTPPPTTAAADLTGRKVLVTGGASGIGAACARQFAAAGATVVVADLDEAGASRVAAAIGGSGGAAAASAVDMADPGFDAAALAADADVIVNNAGIQHVAPVEEFPEERFRLILALMLEAPFRLVRAALPHMYAQGWGRVVNISSVHGLRASAYKSAYVAAKHGLEGLSKVIALEGGGRGVTSNTICPAYVRTPLVEKQIADQARVHGIPEPEVIEKIMLTEPAVKRLVEPWEVADLAVHLCSPQMSFANWSSIVLDGGWTAR